MKLSEIKTACIKLMQTAYPATEYRYYANTVNEKYTRPCFLTRLTVDPGEPANKHTRHNTGMFEIEFLQDKLDEYEALEVMQTLRDLFGFAIRVGKRYVKVVESDFDYDGTEENVATITFMLDWFDNITRPEEEPPLMEDVKTKLRIVYEGG